MAAAATCSGRAEPDIAADGDPETGANVFTNKGQHGTVGGTSLASPLVAGMAVLTQAYYFKVHGKLPGFAGPAIYQLGNSSKLYNTYFHDVRCGFDGAPAQVGWDQASGFGSMDWFNFARGVAGVTVTPVKRTFPYCTPVTKANQLMDPWDGFLAWPVYSENEKAVNEAATWANSSSNPMHIFHGSAYTSHGAGGSILQTDTFDLNGDGSFGKTGTIDYLATPVKTNTQAVALVSDVLHKFSASKTTGNSCLDDHGLPGNDDFPGAPVDCSYFGPLTLANGSKAFYGIMAEQNAVVEVLATCKASDAPKGSSREQNLANAFSLVLASGISQVNQATNSGSGEQF